MIKHILGFLILFSFAFPAIAQEPASQPSYPESDQGLQQYIQDLLNAAGSHDQNKLMELSNAMLIPDAKKWFEDTFPADVAKRLLDEYNKDLNAFPRSFAQLLMKLDKPQALTITVSHVATLDDPNAKGYQKLALAAMQETVPLYTARISRPGTSANITLWSMVYVDGHFRLAGKMRAIATNSTTVPADR